MLKIREILRGNLQIIHRNCDFAMYTQAENIHTKFINHLARCVNIMHQKQETLVRLISLNMCKMVFGGVFMFSVVK